MASNQCEQSLLPTITITRGGEGKMQFTAAIPSKFELAASPMNDPMGAGQSKMLWTSVFAEEVHTKQWSQALLTSALSNSSLFGFSA